MSCTCKCAATAKFETNRRYNWPKATAQSTRKKSDQPQQQAWRPSGLKFDRFQQARSGPYTSSRSQHEAETIACKWAGVAEAGCSAAPATVAHASSKASSNGSSTGQSCFKASIEVDVHRGGAHVGAWDPWPTPTTAA